ncbi:DUF4132 domain-containing protein [Flammeovirga sp. SJP92]|uniref:DUF4132 domain-containing protein n=1 Tax=Flammeovirga sp. SJP92 TaxID=1775430 RepID=UPI0007899E97|nr:DUF4132 domain-containing protein [Flammeovirga sp. SJP92]KXX72388.1 hypothetical protein AVL50_01950 [Flammeovirga sp. SJP92]
MSTIEINHNLNQFTDKVITRLNSEDYYYSRDDESRALEAETIRELATFIPKNEKVNTAFLDKVNKSYLSETRSFLSKVIHEAFTNSELSWVLNQRQFLSSLLEKTVADKYYLTDSVGVFLRRSVEFLETDKAIENFHFILDLGYSEAQIFNFNFERYNDNFLYQYHYHKEFSSSVDKGQELSLTKFGEVLKAYLANTPTNKLFDFLIGKDVHFNNYREHKLELVYFLRAYFKDVFKKSFVGLTKRNGNYRNEKIDFDALKFFIKLDTEGYIETIIQHMMDDKEATIAEQLTMYILFNEADEKYDEQIKQCGERYLETTFIKGELRRKEEIFTHKREPYISEAYFDYLMKQDKAAAFERISTFFVESPYLLSHHFDFLKNNYKEEMQPLLILGLKKDKQTYKESRFYFESLTEAFLQSNLDECVDELFDFAFKCTLKDPKDAICGLISKSDAGIARCLELTKSKKAKERVIAVQVLNKLEGEKSLIALAEIVELEGNDDSRDSILQKIHHIRFEKAFTKEKVEAMIEAAALRKKLSKWGEKKLDESSLPKLYYKDGSELDEKAVRFLFYRMKRAKGINSDIEAKQLLQLIDLQKADKFAKTLIQTFKDSNADTKIKYYLTLAGLLGDDQVTAQLITLFNQSMRDTRMKMCEYILGALAMVGTDKALRMIDQVYRKYMNKKPSLAEVAKTSLVVAANELNITLDDLADRIIPNFDFEDNFKTFEVEGEEYRAFINSDFKLNYLNEDNKMRKSMPKGISAEVKKELKEIEKGIKEATKGQTLRLERYLVEERRWKNEEWQSFFFNNPILFVYASQLIWGAFDEKGALQESFYCDEDMCFYNAEGDEVELEEEHFIGILHPIYLSEEQLQAWKQVVYDNDIKTVFPILERKIIHPTQEELESNKTNRFKGQKVPRGASFVGTFLERRSWRKEASGGGSAEFKKIHHTKGIAAYPYIEGPAMFYMGEEEATVETIYFGPEGRHFYSCSSGDGKKQFTLKDVPAVFYSEVLADIQELLEA